MENAIFISNIPKDFTESDVYTLLSQTGIQVQNQNSRISTAKNCMGAQDSTGRYMVIFFQTKDDVNAAIAALGSVNITISGKQHPLRTSRFVPNFKQRSSGRYNIVVRNLPGDITDSALREAYAGFGEVICTAVVFDEDADKNKHHRGYVMFEKEEDAERAVQGTNGKYLGRNKVEVAFFVPVEIRIEQNKRVLIKNIPEESFDNITVVRDWIFERITKLSDSDLSCYDVEDFNSRDLNFTYTDLRDLKLSAEEIKNIVLKEEDLKSYILSVLSITEAEFGSNSVEEIRKKLDDPKSSDPKFKSKLNEIPLKNLTAADLKINKLTENDVFEPLSEQNKEKSDLRADPRQKGSGNMNCSIDGHGPVMRKLIIRAVSSKLIETEYGKEIEAMSCLSDGMRKYLAKARLLNSNNKYVKSKKSISIYGLAHGKSEDEYREYLQKLEGFQSLSAPKRDDIDPKKFHINVFFDTADNAKLAVERINAQQVFDEKIIAEGTEVLAKIFEPAPGSKLSAVHNPKHSEGTGNRFNAPSNEAHGN
ncbi:putative Polyadenylate-binding protein [Giardia muris]|uniref:Putative Polyadenylate-binding protein n=1 Tax=Giardia muris TaxID=5742 RepID=A0A4Z1SS96_GIAMU|nr:putative Polyadenylate-binding protein [Giardia muris]|eukprot:TNJ28812.1 putative Polyadenylate-binding protein [Giardia muris]